MTGEGEKSFFFCLSLYEKEFLLNSCSPVLLFVLGVAVAANYSARRATIGSTADARRDGSHAAARALAARIATTTAVKAGAARIRRAA
jgi:hypothetical protein